MSTDSFTRWHEAHVAETARDDLKESLASAIGLVGRAERFRPVFGEILLTAIGETYEERKAAVDSIAYQHNVKAGPGLGGYCAKVKLSGLAVIVLASPVRADRPAPVVTEDEGSDAERLVAA